MKYLILFTVLQMSIWVNAQQRYKYVIIPTHFTDFGNDLNPYGICSTLQAELDKHSIKGVFANNEIPDDYCEVLTVNVVKVQNLLRNKLRVEFKDCSNKVVWSNEGAGRSKDYREGFGEAVVEALKDLNQLPLNKTKERVMVHWDAEDTVPVIATIPEIKPESVAPKTQSAEDYKPVNPYYNSTYLVDVVEVSDNKKELLILNGESLGYKSRQKLAMLSPSGLENVFTISWIKPGGATISGVARLTAGKLEISLKEDGKEEVVVLQKL